MRVNFTATRRGLENGAKRHFDYRFPYRFPYRRFLGPLVGLAFVIYGIWMAQQPILSLCRTWLGFHFAKVHLHQQDRPRCVQGEAGINDGFVESRCGWGTFISKSHRNKS